MKKLALLLLALLVPVALAIGIAMVALPEMLPAIRENTTAIVQKATAKPKYRVPSTLEDAMNMAAERLSHLQKLSQAQWDKERATIAHKMPPETIEAAIARTQQRIEDLQAMTPEEWVEEKKRLQKRAGQ